MALTLALGLVLAVTLNDPRVRGQKLYRSIPLLPYAIPGFISIPVWSGFFNQDFGLINNLTGLYVNWLGDPFAAKAALLLLNLWLGFPYMFLVTTGALQAIPADVREAATIDGAGRLAAFGRITFPLVLVAHEGRHRRRLDGSVVRHRALIMTRRRPTWWPRELTSTPSTSYQRSPRYSTGLSQRTRSTRNRSGPLPKQ